MKFLFRTVVFILIVSSFSQVQGQWVRTGGPEGGLISGITKLDDVLFAFRDVGEIYRSEDGGNTWILSMTGIPPFAQVKKFHNTGDTLLVSTENEGLWWSDDGITWSLVTTHPPLYVASSEVFMDGNNIYVSSDWSGMYYSNDLGESWGFDDNGLYIRSFTKHKGIVYGATYTGLYETTNNGASWESVDLGDFSESGIRGIKSTGDVFYMACNGAVAVSSNDFVNWTSSGDIEDWSILGIHESGDSVYAFSIKDIYYTTNEGINWTKVPGIDHHSILSVWLEESGIFMGTRRGLFKSDNLGVSWNESHSGIYGTSPRGLHENETFMFAGTAYDGIFRSADQGVSWTSLDGLANLATTFVYPYHVEDVLVLGDTVLAGTQSGIGLSLDNGDSWTWNLDPGVNKGVYHLAFSNGVLVATASGEGIYVSSDTAQNWNAPSMNGFNSMTANYTALEVVGDTVILSDNQQAIYLSTDLGENWSDISFELQSFFTLEALKWYDSSIYAGTTQGVYRSNDMGQTWSLLDGIYYFTDLEILNGKIYAATSKGVFISSVHHDEWILVNEDLEDFLEDIWISDTHAYVNTVNKGVWRRPLDEMNLAPKYLGPSETLFVAEEQAREITLDDLDIFDPDNDFPGDFTLYIFPSSDYDLSGTTVVPLNDYNGQLLVNAAVYDGQEWTPTFQIELQVTPVNDVPVITGDNLTTIDQNSSLTVLISHLTIEDPDNTTSDFSLMLTEGENYSISENVITPDPGYLGALVVPLTVTDGTDISDPFDLELTVEIPNEPPTITGLTNSLSIPEDASLELKLTDLVVEDSDGAYPEGYTLTILDGENFTLESNTIMPDSDFFGELSIEVRVNDGEDDSETYEFNISVTPVNDPPAILGIVSAISIDEDAFVELTPDQFNISDPDNQSFDTYQVVILEGENYSANGSILNPESNFFGTLSVDAYLVDDNLSSNTFKFDATVLSINDAPVITGVITEWTLISGSSVTMTREDFTYSDPDHGSDAMELIVMEGENYEVEGTTITSASGFEGILSIPVVMTDGIDVGPSFTVEIQVTITTGLTFDAGFNLFPNPSDGLMTITLVGKRRIVEVKVANLSGKVLQKLYFERPGKKIDVDLRALQEGVYLVWVTFEDGTTEITKLVHNRSN